jgi:glycosyltransferase involved in cell wall biosynthesis
VRVGVDATSWINRRGFGRFVRNAVGRLVERDENTTYLFFIDEESADGAELPDQAEVHRVRMSQPPSRAAAAGSSRSVRDLLRLTAAVRRARPDAFLFPSLYTWFPVVGTPTVLGIHDVMIEELPELTVHSRRERAAVALKHRAGVRTARTLFTVSETARRAIVERLGIRADRLHVVPEAADDVFFPRVGAELVAGLQAVGLRPHEAFFVNFGGLSPHKNVELLIDAYAGLGAGAPRLVLVGELETSTYLSSAGAVRERIARNGLEHSVLLTGYVSDEVLACLCSAAAAIVLPSLAEGFGLPAVEAAACGAPLVLSELDAHRETSGDAALYFSPTDPRALTEVLARVAADGALRSDLSAKALAASRTRTWDAAADALARLVAGTVRAG